NALVLDVADLFKPLITFPVILTLLQTGRITLDHFEQRTVRKKNAVWFKREGMKEVVQAFEAHMNRVPAPTLMEER
ncbi:MAG: CRISPR-associated endonuclease Cas1, partial [Calditerricola sp.]|nr:CRISPR-associated endonuclease Cas1 [Calditerricola sp.]